MCVCVCVYVCVCNSVCVCVGGFTGFHRLHSFSRVHCHRFCGLPGKQEDPSPKMVDVCPKPCL